jgi:alcohol dehydrogenase (cytochrome c)
MMIRGPQSRSPLFLGRLAILAYSAAILCAQVTEQQLREAQAGNWLHYNGSYDSRRHSPLKQINSDTIDSLVPKWVFHVPGATHLETVPIVVDGVMYVTQPNEVYAIDARSGRQIWEYHRVPAIQKGPNRGVAVWNDKVYFTTPDAFLVALHAATGNVIWETKLAEAKDGYWSPGAPLVVKGKVIAGIAPGDHGLNGFLDAYDAKTGERLWRFNPIPKPGEPGSESWAGDSWKTAGGNTWLTGSYDPELNLLYWGIGNPAPDFNGDVRMGDNLYTECVVALDLDSGKLRWHFQFTPHDTMDWDAVEIPILVDAPYQGKMRKLMAHADRPRDRQVPGGDSLRPSSELGQRTYSRRASDPDPRHRAKPQRHGCLSVRDWRSQLAIARLQPRYRPCLCGRARGLRIGKQVHRDVPSGRFSVPCNRRCRYPR